MAQETQLKKLKFEPKYCFLPSIKVSSPPLLALLPLLPHVFKLFEPVRLGLERERVELGHQFVPISLESLALCLLEKVCCKDKDNLLLNC